MTKTNNGNRHISNNNRKRDNKCNRIMKKINKTITCKVCLNIFDKLVYIDICQRCKKNTQQKSNQITIFEVIQEQKEKEIYEIFNTKQTSGPK